MIDILIGLVLGTLGAGIISISTDVDASERSLMRSKTIKMIPTLLKKLPKEMWERRGKGSYIHENEKIKFQIVYLDNVGVINCYKKEKLFFSLHLINDEATKMERKISGASKKTTNYLKDSLIDLDDKWVSECLIKMKEMENAYQKKIQIMTPEKLKKDWEMFQQNQNDAYYKMTSWIKKANLDKNQSEYKDEFFKTNIYSKNGNLYYTIAFKNGIKLFSGNIRKEGENRKINTLFHNNFIKSEKRDELMNILNGHLNFLNGYERIIHQMDSDSDWKKTDKTQVNRTFNVLNNKEEQDKSNYFFEILLEIEEMKKEKEFLLEEEWHLLTHTIPNDLKQLNQTYDSLNEESKKNEKNNIDEIKYKMQEWLNELKIKAENRKIQKLHHQIRVVEARER